MTTNGRHAGSGQVAGEPQKTSAAPARPRRRPWPCTAGHQHTSEAKAILCQAKIIVRWFRERPTWVPSAERVRAHFRRIPAEERDDEPRVRVGQFDWRRLAGSLVWGSIGFLVAFGSLVALIAGAVGLIFLGAWAVWSGHEWMPATWLALIVSWPLAVAAVQRPRIRAALVWLRDMYSAP